MLSDQSSKFFIAIGIHLYVQCVKLWVLKIFIILQKYFFNVPYFFSYTESFVCTTVHSNLNYFFPE